MGVNPFFWAYFPSENPRRAPGHSRLDNAGAEGDYSIFDERPFL